MLAADIFNPALTERFATRLGGSWAQWALRVQVDEYVNPDGTRYALLHTPDRDLRVVLRHSDDDTLPFSPEEWQVQLRTTSGNVLAHGINSKSRGVHEFVDPWGTR